MKKVILMMMLFAPLTMFAQKFGHCDAQAIMQQMPEFIKAKGEVDALQKQKENELKSMQEELQRKYEAYEKAQSTMSATKKQENETELGELNQKIQQAFQDGQQELAKASQERMQPITNKLVQAIKNVGKNGGYVYIMDIASGVPYISETLSKDVTNDVKAELNKIK
ncbi:MAG: OmpH family outer membrane protein [Prevotellaceae bacterium]|nr:OmpH family outer membrane protein [Prevotella sp.]MDD7530858.1 OmpH family outer membrane protein [Prevotellaceae bacterium]MDY2633264.1 OmpH family outer membrane protein [Prevotella sp.]